MISFNPARNYKRPFIQFVKAVEAICADPDAGEPKISDLAEVRVYKFRFNHQEYLITYRSSSQTQGGHNEPVEFLTIDFTRPAYTKISTTL
jgi:hypothetical protein